MKAPSLAHSLIASAIFTLITLAPAVAQIPKSVERPGDGKPTCGLGKEFHAGRRAALCKALESGIIVCRGEPDQRDFLRFHQSKVFWYLTGIESPNANVIIDVASAKATLFLPPRDKMSESWEGELWDSSDEWIKDVTGVDSVRKNADFGKAIAEAAAKSGTVWVPMAPHVELAGCREQAEGYDRSAAKDQFDGRPSRERRFADRLKELYQIDVKDCTVQLDELRRVKQPEEIAAMRRAGRAGALAMAEAMRSTRAGLGEWELEAVMDFIQVKEGASGPAYGAIVGSGPNSLVLHYMNSARIMRSGEVLLIDYAPELDHYTCDITRTWPIDGTFTPRQRELYEAVLAAQNAGIAAVKPGATIRDVASACDGVFKERGLQKFARHSPCHYIGMEVHDVGEYRKPLVPGVAFTIEPGLYENETGIGIRIEDVVIVTEQGCEIVSELAPRAVAEIERTVNRNGVLGWMERRSVEATAEHK